MQRFSMTGSCRPHSSRGAFWLFMALVFMLQCVLPVQLLAQDGAAESVQTQGDVYPPIQRANEIMTPPFYKRWWFWTLVGAVVIGGVAVAAGSGGGGDSNAPAGNTTVTGPALPK